MRRFKSTPACQSWAQSKLPLTGALPRILVVDDYPEAAEALASYLILEGIEAQVATGGAEALVLAQVWRPSVLILDIHMPEFDGFATAAALRNDARRTSIAIVAFTAVDASEMLRRATPGDFDGYCQKGVPPAMLLALVKSLLYAGQTFLDDTLDEKHRRLSDRLNRSCGHG
jgi:two-component system OmpR family response regulator